jgi:ferric-dicitrate binding protein FerR (iron transport regulator)
MLVAGEQLQINKKGKLKLIEHADTEAAVAWKEGLFSFIIAELPASMRKVR